MRRRSLRLRLLVLGALLLAVVAGLLAVGAPARLEAVVRSYLAEERVRRWRAELLFAAEESGVDPYLLAALMLRESSGRVDARSPKGALGLFQLRPITYEWRARELGLPPPTEEELLRDGLLNARLGANNLRWLLDTFDGDAERALVAYNLGTRRLKELCDAAGGWEAWRVARLEAGDSNLLAFAARILAMQEQLRAKGVLAAEEGGGPADEPPGGQGPGSTK
ncbi:MAG: transglycosylase SLT domain-containing protein [Planctomycetota bacterium]